MTKVLDVVAAALVATAVVARLLVRRCLPRRRPRRLLLVFDGSYSLATMRERELLPVITARDLGGWFDHVWTVHPLIGASPEHVGQPSSLEPVVLADRHTVIEGSVHDARVPTRLPRLGVAIAQSRLIRALDRLIRREGIAFVQAGDPFYQGLIAWSLARAHRRAFVVRVGANYDAIHGSIGELAYPRLIPSSRLQRRVGRFVLSRADMVFAANANNGEYAIANGAAPERLVVVPAYGNVLHPVHLTDPAARRPPGDVQFDRPYVVCVGRLEPVKHPQDVLEAVSIARRRHPDLAVVMVGAGRMLDELREHADALDLRNAVLFVGARDQVWIAGTLARSQVVAAPMTGRALVEAALSGTPIVAYDIEWHSELVKDGETGWLVPYLDTEAMGSTIADLLDDPARARSVGAEARRQVLERIAPERVRATLVDAYGAIACRAVR